jgi:hypothetical protein
MYFIMTNDGEMRDLRKVKDKKIQAKEFKDD